MNGDILFDIGAIMIGGRAEFSPAEYHNMRRMFTPIASWLDTTGYGSAKVTVKYYRDIRKVVVQADGGLYHTNDGIAVVKLIPI